MKKPYRRARAACCFGSLTMSAVSSLSPLLLSTFHDAYGISYGLLGLLAVLCFGIQLAIDLVFSFFSSRFDIRKTLIVTPLFAFFGVIVYAVLPPLFPSLAYLWLAIGTLTFSVSSGLCEVLLSPLIAAIPTENPEREMSLLHSVYAWGVAGVVTVSTGLLALLGRGRWYLVAGLWSLLPLCAFFLFAGAELPQISTDAQKGKRGLPKGLIPCVLCIFMGGASELTMTQWAASFFETAVGIPKAVGDIFGLALFALLLGVMRTLYGKWGSHIYRTMLWGMAGTVVCYLLCALSPHPLLSLIGCVCTGLTTAMLWPGSLILMEERCHGAGVAAFALMAAGGDAGASVGPQLMGLIVDGVMGSAWAPEVASRLSLTAEQLGMKVGMVATALFPLCGFLILLYMGHPRKKDIFQKTLDKAENVCYNKSVK